MINYFIKCRDAEFRHLIFELSKQHNSESVINMILDKLDIEIKGNIIDKTNSLEDSGLFFVSYSKNYSSGDIGVSQCGIQIMDKEGRL